MKVTIVLLVLGLTSSLMAYVNLRREFSLFRTRANNLSNVEIYDGTRKIQPVEDGPNTIVFTGAYVSYSPIPRLTVNEWAAAGMVGGPYASTSLQWSCPPGYELKWDGDVPYCEAQ